MVDNQEEKYHHEAFAWIESEACASDGGAPSRPAGPLAGFGSDLELVDRARRGDLDARLAIHHMTLGIRVKEEVGIDTESIRSGLAWRLFSGPHRLAAFTGRSGLRSYLASAVRREVSSARRAACNREHLLRQIMPASPVCGAECDHLVAGVEHPAQLVRAAIHESLYDGCFHRNGPGAPTGLAGAIGRGMLDAIEDLIAIHSQLFVLGHLGSIPERPHMHGPVLDAYAAAGMPVRGGRVSRHIVEIGTEATIDLIDSVCDAMDRSALRGRKPMLARLRAARECGRGLLRGSYAA
jgi:hypothetical protein